MWLQPHSYLKPLSPEGVLSQPCCSPWHYWALCAQLQHSHVAHAEGNSLGRCTAALLARTLLLCYCGMNVLNHSKGKKYILCHSVCVTITVLCLGPCPTHQSMDIYFGAAKSTSDWVRWSVLHLQYVSCIKALVEIAALLLSLTSLISLCHSALHRGSLQGSRHRVTTPESSHSKN